MKIWIDTKNGGKINAERIDCLEIVSGGEVYAFVGVHSFLLDVFKTREEAQEFIDKIIYRIENSFSFSYTLGPK